MHSENFCEHHIFSFGTLRMVVVAVFFFHFVRVGNMGAKDGIRKGASRISKPERIKEPAHQNYYEQKRRGVANRLTFRLNESFTAS
jgi:hypothetical protein